MPVSSILRPTPHGVTALKRCNRGADRGLGHVQGLGRTRHVLALRNRHEHPELVERHCLTFLKEERHGPRTDQP